MLRFGMNLPANYALMLLGMVPIAIITKIPVFYYFGFYNQLWQYASLREALRLFRGITIASFAFLAALFFMQKTDIPRGVFTIDWLLTLFAIGGNYFTVRAKKELFPTLNFSIKGGIQKDGQKNVIVVGAGEAGSTLVKQMLSHPEKGYKPVAIIDDDLSKNGLMIHGIKVIGSTKMMPSLLSNLPADEIILAIPSASLQAKRSIVLKCQEIGIPCKTIPDFADLVEGKTDILNISSVDIKNLLGRKETEFDLKNAIECYKGKTILITGAAGSIGSELCRQLVDLEPKRIIAADISENGLYHLEEESISWLNGDRKGFFEVRVMDVKDSRAVERIFKAYKPEVIFHAAAYKHVPMMERHPIEAMENNFLGTRVMIAAAKRYNSERFVLISTDKAVNPTSIMGLSKQLAEQSVKVAASESNSTKFMAVRFGNVLGSNGSVVPKFKRQISSGGPITVTHPDITRYFMTIHEAVYLVIQAAAMGMGGEIFLLNMGKPVRIVDLARSMIRLSGLEPEKDIPIEFIGLRPGEKLYEELYGQDEAVNKTRHPQIFEVCGAFNEAMLIELLSELEAVVIKEDGLNFANFLSQNYLARAA
ncbi:MAG: nucleoside-diphosphate sugar epimerase/dehydratase [Actinomycetota bacterium]